MLTSAKIRHRIRSDKTRSRERTRERTKERTRERTRERTKERTRERKVPTMASLARSALSAMMLGWPSLDCAAKIDDDINESSRFERSSWPQIQ